MNWNRVLLISAVGLGLMAVLPSRFTGFWGIREGLRSGADLLISPARAPLAWMLRSARGTSSSSTDPEAVKRALDEAAEWKREYLRQRSENDALRRQIEQIARVAQLNPAFAAKEVGPLPVDGLVDRLLLVRGGSTLGITPNAVAVADRVHLIGRVVSADRLICRVRPISEYFGRDNPEIKGVILGDERFASPDSTAVVADFTKSGRATVRLRATERSTLQGIVYFEGPLESALRPEVGMAVRLNDESWGADHQMLIIGRIVKVEDAPNGRPVIVVVPAIDPQRLSELSVRFSAGEARP